MFDFIETIWQPPSTDEMAALLDELEQLSPRERLELAYGLLAR
ncbi:MAG: hypothetical protein Q8M19_04575 [Reyranella sp.]|nr:hypothetical protein [Reyranella sp.]